MVLNRNPEVDLEDLGYKFAIKLKKLNIKP